MSLFQKSQKFGRKLLVLTAAALTIGAVSSPDTAHATYTTILSCAAMTTPLTNASGYQINLLVGDKFTIDPSGVFNVTPPGGPTTPYSSFTTFVVGAGQAGQWNVYNGGGTQVTVQCVLADDNSAGFVGNRVTTLLGGTNDLSTRLNPSATSLDGSGSSDSGAFSFYSSLSAANSAANKRIDSTFPLAKNGAENSHKRSVVDIWAKIGYNWTDAGDVDSKSGIVTVGADYAISPDTLLGVLAQVDVSDDKGSSSSTAATAEGLGWLVGPYVVSRITENLIFDGQLAAGQSDNKVSPNGTYTDKFGTSRFLVKGQLTGNFQYNSMTFSPFLRAIYYVEETEAFTDGNGAFVSSKTDTVGQLTFGPRVSRDFETSSGWKFSPYVTMSGSYDFNQGSNNYLSSTGDVERLKATFASGMTLISEGGIQVFAKGSYDGIGVSDYERFGGKLKIAIPLY